MGYWVNYLLRCQTLQVNKDQCFSFGLVIGQRNNKCRRGHRSTRRMIFLLPCSFLVHFFLLDFFFFFSFLFLSFSRFSKLPGIRCSESVFNRLCEIRTSWGNLNNAVVTFHRIDLLLEMLPSHTEI